MSQRKSLVRSHFICFHSFFFYFSSPSHSFALGRTDRENEGALHAKVFATGTIGVSPHSGRRPDETQNFFFVILSIL